MEKLVLQTTANPHFIHQSAIRERADHYSGDGFVFPRAEDNAALIDGDVIQAQHLRDAQWVAMLRHLGIQVAIKDYATDAAFGPHPVHWPPRLVKEGAISSVEYRDIDLKKAWALLSKKVEFDASGCVIFCGSKTRYGYGKVTTRKVKQSGQAWLETHRLAYLLEHGSIPDGAMIRHTCGKRACVNPLHLRPGTHKDNMLDKALDGTGRWRRGEMHSSSKLTKADKANILAMRDRGYTQTKIAKHFKVSQATISVICSGVNYDVLNAARKQTCLQAGVPAKTTLTQAKPAQLTLGRWEATGRT